MLNLYLAYSKSFYQNFKNQRNAYAHLPYGAPNLQLGKQEIHEIIGCIVIRGYYVFDNTDFRHCTDAKTLYHLRRLSVKELFNHLHLDEPRLDEPGCILFDYADHYTPDLIINNNVCVRFDGGGGGGGGKGGKRGKRESPDYVSCVDFKNTALLTRFHDALLTQDGVVYVYKDAPYYQLKMELGIPGGVEEFEIAYDCPQFPDEFTNVRFVEEGDVVEISRVEGGVPP